MWTPSTNNQNTSANQCDNPDHQFKHKDHLKHRVRMAVPDDPDLSRKKPFFIRLQLRLWPGDLECYLGIHDNGELDESLVSSKHVRFRAPSDVRGWKECSNKAVIKLLELKVTGPPCK